MEEERPRLTLDNAVESVSDVLDLSLRGGCFTIITCAVLLVAIDLVSGFCDLAFMVILLELGILGRRKSCHPSLRIMTLERPRAIDVADIFQSQIYP